MFSPLRSRRAAVGLAVAALAGSFAVWSQQPGFTTSSSENLVRQYSARFGPEARPRLAGWRDFARLRKAEGGFTPVSRSPELQLLSTVNRFINVLPFLSDQLHWGVEDYWATPAESIASNGADCEDFSVAKFFLLKELGVPVGRLRITYVKAIRLNQAHMVVAYYPTPDADPFILDNLENTVRRASQRTDLVPVYSFNDDELWLAQSGRAGSPLQIRMWRGLLEKLEREART